MAADDARRHRLLRKLERVLGSEEAATLMEHLHPDRWDALATRADLAALKSDVHALRVDVGALRVDVGALRVDVGALRVDLDALKGEVGTVRAELAGFRAWTEQQLAAQQRWTAERFARVDAQIDGARQEVVATVRGEMNRLVTAQARMLVIALVGALTANTGLVLGILRFGAPA